MNDTSKLKSDYVVLSCTVVHITHTSAKICLSLGEVDAFYAVWSETPHLPCNVFNAIWSETPHLPFNVFYAFKSCWCFIKNGLSYILCFLGYFVNTGNEIGILY